LKNEAHREQVEQAFMRHLVEEKFFKEIVWYKKVAGLAIMAEGLRDENQRKKVEQTFVSLLTNQAFYRSFPPGILPNAGLVELSNTIQDPQSKKEVQSVLKERGYLTEEHQSEQPSQQQQSRLIPSPAQRQTQERWRTEQAFMVTKRLR
jgi:hypothetical protein